MSTTSPTPSEVTAGGSLFAFSESMVRHIAGLEDPDRFLREVHLAYEGGCDGVATLVLDSEGYRDRQGGRPSGHMIRDETAGAVKVSFHFEHDVLFYERDESGELTVPRLYMKGVPGARAVWDGNLECWAADEASLQ